MKILASQELETLRALSALRGGSGIESPQSSFNLMLDEIRRRQTELIERYAAAVDPYERIGLSHQRALLADLAVWACERRNEAYGS